MNIQHANVLTFNGFIFMSIAWLSSLVLGIFLLAGIAPDFPAGIFTEKEAGKIKKESDDVEGRIKVYQKASERMLRDLRNAVSEKKFQTVPENLSTWKILITESLKDIEANLERKKKRPRSLIKFEIQVRKAIKDIQDFKIRAPVDQQDIFNSCIDSAESVRARMVEILFNPEQQE